MGGSKYWFSMYVPYRYSIVTSQALYLKYGTHDTQYSPLLVHGEVRWYVHMRKASKLQCLVCCGMIFFSGTFPSYMHVTPIALRHVVAFNSCGTTYILFTILPSVPFPLIRPSNQGMTGLMGVFSFGNFFLESKFPQLATVQANKVGIAFIIWLRLSILFYNFIASFILTPSTSIFLIHSQHKQRDHYLHSCQIETAMSLDSNVLCHLKDIRFFHCRKKTVFMRLEGELVPGYLFSTCDPPLLQ